MTLELNFRQPAGGVINMGTKGNQPMSFQFSGARSSTSTSSTKTHTSSSPENWKDMG